MAIGLNPGTVCDLYREHVLANPATYSGNVTDDFHTNAVRAQTPTQPSLPQTSSAYGAAAPGVVGGVTVKDSWNQQLRQALVQQ